MDTGLKLSIIIPVYNVATHLEKCFKSVVDVNNALDYEIIFVNDGSTDDSLEVLEGLTTFSDNVTIISQDNKGLSGARNTGIDAAKGKYVIFLDADDWVDFGIIKDLLSFSIKNHLDLTSYRLRFVHESSSITVDSGYHPVTYNHVFSGLELLIQGYQPSSSCLFLYNRDFLILNKLSFYPKIAQQDVEFTLRVMLLAKRVYFSDKIGYNYFRHPGTISLPTTVKKLEKYLGDAIIVAGLMKANIQNEHNRSITARNVIQKNYNSVTWNLIWRFVSVPKEVDKDFKMHCIKLLQEKKLYPITGPLKSNFQRVTRVFFNSPSLLKLVFSLQS